MVARTNPRITMDVNHSIAGAEAQKMSIMNKIGIALFVLGIIGLIELISTSIVEHSRLNKTENFELFIFGSFGLMLAGIALFTRKKGESGYRNIFFKNTNTVQKIGLSVGLIGFGNLVASWVGVELEPATLYLWLSMGLMASGILIYTFGTYAGHTKGIKNNHVYFNSLTNGGILGWVAGVALTLFYIQIYWFADSLEGMIRMFDPLAYLITGGKASQWFVYGTIYTFLIFFLGIKFLVKYRHNRYQIIRTISVIFFQVVFAYTIPHILESFSEGQAYFQKDLKNVWPLDYGFSNPNRLDALSNAGVSGTFYFFWGLIMFLVVTPVLTYYVGKRWYCSWVCGCGGLAETAGDGFRQLSSKKESAWKIERWVVHSVMVFVLIMSVAALWPYFSGSDYTISFLTITKTSYLIATLTVLGLVAILFFLGSKKYKNSILKIGAIILLLIGVLLTIAYFTGSKEVFSLRSLSIKKTYGFIVGAAFAGVIGVGFYPILGNRVWCRFGCPMAAYMGLFQRFKSRFRITTNGSQCISCGNCSTYCEQGIDVRAYAQKGENIIRSSCVGCGICSAVCPRGVLKLENGPEKGRFDPNPLIVTKDGVKLNA